MPSSTRAARAIATDVESVPPVAEADPAPVRKRRGRPPKNPTTAIPPMATTSLSADVDASKVTAKKPPTKKPPTKKGNKRVNPSVTAPALSNDEDSNSPIHNDDPAPGPPQKRARKAPQTPRRDPLPSRLRNDHPGKPDIPRPKRTSAEVQAAIEELKTIEVHKQEIEARKIQLYAALEMQDEADQETEGQNVVRTLAQVHTEEGPEEFSFSAIDAEESEDDKEDESREEKGTTRETKERPKKAVCNTSCLYI